MAYSLGGGPGPRANLSWIYSMSAIAAGERPSKAPKCFIYKLQSDSGKPDFPYVDLQFLTKITEMLLWVKPYGLRHFIIFLYFFKFLTIDKTKTLKIITFS